MAMAADDRDVDVVNRVRDVIRFCGQDMSVAYIQARVRVRRQTLFRALNKLVADRAIAKGFRIVESDDGRPRRGTTYSVAVGASGGGSRRFDGGSHGVRQRRSGADKAEGVDIASARSDYGEAQSGTPLVSVRRSQGRSPG